MVDLDATAAAIVRLFANVTRYPDIFATIKRVDIRSRTPARSVAYVEAAFQWPLGDRWVQLETVVTGDRVRWRRMDGSIRRFEGSLVATDLPAGRSRVIYDAIVDPGWAAPGWLTAWLESRVEDALVADTRRYLRDHADEVAERPSAR